MIARFWWWRLWRGQAFEHRVVERRFKPVHWHLDHGVPIGYSADDLDRLADIGARVLEGAGIGRRDVLVGVMVAGPHLPYWQLVLGANRASVSSMFLPEAATPGDVARLEPTALAGGAGALHRLLRGVVGARLALGGLRTLVVVDGPLRPAARARLELAARTATRGSTPVAVVVAWAPPGVRALWAECRGGTGLHTWADSEVVELVDPLSGTPAPPGADGEVVWTPLGWCGSVLLRLRTGAYASADPSPCPACGRPGVRLLLGSDEPPFARILDSHPGVARWQAELRTVAEAEELIVFLTPHDDVRLDTLLDELDRQLSVTQFVVLEPEELEARLSAHDDSVVIDLRR